MGYPLVGIATVVIIVLLVVVLALGDRRRVGAATWHGDYMERTEANIAREGHRQD